VWLIIEQSVIELLAMKNPREKERGFSQDAGDSFERDDSRDAEVVAFTRLGQPSAFIPARQRTVHL
jgi:hypothetical protein